MSEKDKKSAPSRENDPKGSLLNMYTRKAGLSHFLGVTTQQIYTEPLGELDFVGAVSRLVEEGKRIQNGNLVYIERMLLIQAQTLDTIFNNLACRASLTDSIYSLESLMRLALKAQSQCRATLESLANIKNPPQVAFVKQANIGHNQQVNNNVTAEVALRAEEIKKPQTQLMEEEVNDKRLDIGTKVKASNFDKELAPVGEINGAKNS